MRIIQVATRPALVAALGLALACGARGEGSEPRPSDGGPGGSDGEPASPDATSDNPDAVPGDGAGDASSNVGSDSANVCDPSADCVGWTMLEADDGVSFDAVEGYPGSCIPLRAVGGALPTGLQVQRRVACWSETTLAATFAIPNRVSSPGTYELSPTESAASWLLEDADAVHDGLWSHTSGTATLELTYFDTARIAGSLRATVDHASSSLSAAGAVSFDVTL